MRAQISKQQLDDIILDFINNHIRIMKEEPKPKDTYKHVDICFDSYNEFLDYLKDIT